MTGRPAARRAWHHVAYRVGQFWQGLWASVSPEEQATAAAILGPQLAPLFARMPTDAQRHSLNVLAQVRAAGNRHPDLLQAALLHDVGKCATASSGLGKDMRLGLWLRGPLVLLDAFFPRLVARWASADPAHGWRYLMYVHREHPAIGAAWAAAAGASPLCCWLIAQHQTSPDDLPPNAPHDGRRALLAALQAADKAD